MDANRQERSPSASCESERLEPRTQERVEHKSVPEFLRTWGCLSQFGHRRQIQMQASTRRKPPPGMQHRKLVFVPQTACRRRRKVLGLVNQKARPASPGVGFGDSPRGALRGLLDRVCAQEGRPEEAGRWTRYLESEWQTVESLRGLSDSEWEKLKLPLGLAQVLRRRVGAMRGWEKARHAVSGTAGSDRGRASGRA